MQGQGIGSVTQAVLPFCTLSVLTLCGCLFLHGYRWLVLKVLWKKSKKWATVPIATLPSQREKLSQNALPRQRRLSCTSHWPKICHMIDLLASKESRNRCLKFLFSTRVSEIRKGEGLGRVIDEPASCLPHNFSLLVCLMLLSLSLDLLLLLHHLCGLNTLALFLNLWSIAFLF